MRAALCAVSLAHLLNIVALLFALRSSLWFSTLLLPYCLLFQPGQRIGDLSRCDNDINVLYDC